jgi:hypothetical protein
MRKLTGGRIISVGVLAIALVVVPGVARGVDDVTPPTVTVTTPAAGASYAQNATVNAKYSCSDASGIAACVGTVSNGAVIPTQSLGSHEFKVWGYDNAGNKTKVVVLYNVVDKTKPVITLSTPKDGATYAKNSAVFASFSCYDAASDIASCVGTVPNGSNLPTGTKGSKSFTVTAKDTAGNTATKTVSYTVA